MTDDEARTLATRIVDTWPNGPKGYIWRNELTTLDHTHATDAFRDMRRDVERPTLSTFHAYYRAARARTNANQPRPRDCEACGNTGWTPAPDRTLQVAGNAQHTYSQTIPCRCTTGQSHARRVHARIAHDNGWHHDARPTPNTDQLDDLALFGGPSG